MYPRLTGASCLGVTSNTAVLGKVPNPSPAGALCFPAIEILRPEALRDVPLVWFGRRVGHSFVVLRGCSSWCLVLSRAAGGGRRAFTWARLDRPCMDGGWVMLRAQRYTAMSSLLTRVAHSLSSGPVEQPRPPAQVVLGSLETELATLLCYAPPSCRSEEPMSRVTTVSAWLI